MILFDQWKSSMKSNGLQKKKKKKNNNEVTSDSICHWFDNGNDFQQEEEEEDKIEMNRSVRKIFVRYQSSRTLIKENRLSNEEIGQHRLKIFEREKQNQLEKIRRVEKVEIEIDDRIESKRILMNKNLSTPMDCAKHLSSIIVQRSCLALINDKILWDMHRPFENDCKLKFLHFLDENPFEQNRAFWRTSSFITGFILQTSFKPDIQIDLCSFPSPNFQTGSFIYDFQSSIENWKMTNEDFRCLSIQVSKLIEKDLRFERLEISESIAKEMFQYDRLKSRQIPSMFKSIPMTEEQKRLIVYRMGSDHVDICRGPLISSTKQIGRFEFASLHSIDVPSYGEKNFYRLQGLAIPDQLHLHHWTFDYLLKRAKTFNRSSLPSI